MNELQKLYDVLVREGKYTKSFEEFQNQWNDEQYQSKVYEVVHRDGLYTKDRDSFNQKYGAQAKQQPAQEDQGLVGNIKSQFLNQQPQQQQRELPRMPKPGELANIGKEDENATFDSQGNYNPINALPESVRVGAKERMAENKVREEAKKKEALQSDLSAKQKAVESTAQQQADASLLASQSAAEAEALSPLLKNEFLRGVYQQLKDEETLPSFVKDQLSAITPELIFLGEGSLKKQSLGVEQLGVEEAVVPKMNYMFGPLGFKFEETGAGDYMIVKAPNKEEMEISLNNRSMEKNRLESEKLKNFIASNSAKIPQIEKYAAQYAGSDMRFNSEKQIDTQTKAISIQYDNLNKDAELLSNDIKNVESDLAYLNSAPANERNTPQYLEKKKATEAALLDVNTRRQEIISRNSQIEANKTNLDKAVGKYAQMKAQQGTWSGATVSFFGEGISTALTGLLNLSLDITTLGGKSPRMPYYTEEMYKKDKKESLSAVREGIQGAITDPNTSVEWRQLAEEGFWGGAYAGLIKSAPAMLAPGGWAGRTAAFFGQSTDAVNQEMDKNPAFDNVSESEKLLVTVPIGIANAVLEEVGLSNMIKNKGFVNSLVLKGLQKAGVNATETTLSKIIKNDVESMLARGALTLAGAGLAEAETGAGQQIAEYAVKDIYNLAKEKEMFDTPDSLKEYVYDVVRSGAQEAVGGFVMGTPSAAAAAFRKQGFKGMSDEQFETFEAIANDEKMQSSFIATLKTKVTAGDMTMAEAKEELNDYRNSVGLYRSIPTDLSTEAKKEAMNLVREKQVIEERIKDKDEALVKKQKDRIAEINVQLNNLSENAVQEQTTSEVPIQSETAVSEEVAGGKSTAESQVTTEEGKKEEVTPEIQSKIDEIEARRQKELVPEFGYSLNDLFKRGYPEELDNRDDDNVADRISKGIKYVNDKINAKYDAEIADLKSTPITTETTATEEVVSDIDTELKTINESIGRVKQDFNQEEDDRTLSELADKVAEAKRNLSKAEDTDAAVNELKKAEKEKSDFEESLAKRKNFNVVDNLISDEIESSKKDTYEYKDLFEQDPRLAAMQSAKDMIEFAKENPDTEVDIARYENDIKLLEEDIAKFPVKTTKQVTPAAKAAPAPKKRGRKKSSPVVEAPVTETPVAEVTPAEEAPKRMTREEIRAKEKEVAEENRKSKENRGENINVRDYKRTKKRGQDLKVGDVYVRRIGDTLFVYKVLSKLRKYTGQFYTMDVEILHVGNHVNRKEVGPDGEVREDSRRVGNKYIDTFKNMISGSGKFNFGEVIVLENFEAAPEAKTEAAPEAAPAVKEAPATEAAPAAEEKPTAKPKEEPAKGKSLLTDKVRAQISEIVKEWNKTKKRYLKETGEESEGRIELEVHGFIESDNGLYEDLLDFDSFSGLKNINKDIERILENYPNVSRIDFKYPVQADGGDWDWITIYEVPAPAAEAAPAPKAEPAPTPAPAPAKTAKEIKALKELDDEIKSLEKDIDNHVFKIEDLENEIVTERDNKKEGVAEFKEQIAEVKKKISERKKSGIPKETIKVLVEELEVELDELEAKLFQFREDQDDYVESYKEDIAQEKAEMKKAQKRLDKLIAKREQMTQPEAAPKKPGIISMAEIEKRFPLAAEFIKAQYGNVSEVTSKSSLDVLVEAYDQLMRYKVGAEKRLLQIQDIENLVESLEQSVKKVSKEEFKKQIAASGDFTKAQLKIFNALVDSLQTETMPEYMSDEQAAKYNAGTENFYVASLNRIVSKQPEAFMHEIGHFGFFKILSKEDRLKYYQYMIDSNYGKGKPSLASRMAITVDTLLGRSAEGKEFRFRSNAADNFSEYFAQQFSEWYMNERLFPKEIDTIFSKVAQFFNLFIEKLKSGKYVDKNLSEYFNKISAKIEKDQKKNQKIQEDLGIEETMMNELQDLEDFFGIDPAISPMSMRYDTPLQKMALMYNMTETGFFPRNASEPHINRDFFQFGLKAKRASSGSYYLVDIKTGRMVKPLQKPKGGIPPQVSRMSIKTQVSPMNVTIEPIDFENESENIDVYEASEKAEKIAKDNGVNILRGKELISVALDKEGNVIGGLWTEVSDGEFSFDIAIDESSQGKGVGEKLVKEAISEFNSQNYDDNLKYKIDVTNPIMEKLLSKYGFEVSDRIDGHTIMEHPTNNPKLKTTISPQVSRMSVTPISVKDMAMEDVIDTARENGFSDDTIKALLIKRGYDPKEVDSALTFNVNFASAYTNNNPTKDSPLPQAFRTIDGGVSDGIKLFFDVRNKLIDFAQTTKKKGMKAGKRVRTYAEIRAKAIELLEANPIFQAQEDTKQKELIAAFDKTLNIKRGKLVSAQIAEIRKALKERLVGMKDLKKAQLILRNFIRQSLPAVKVPRVFFTLDGLTSPAEGINYFNNLRKQVYDFARTDAEGKMGKKILKTSDEIKDFAISLIKDSELYKKQTTDVQSDMVNGFINSEYTKGLNNTLDIYSQKEVNKLIDIVSQTDAKNFLAQAEKVFDIITEQRNKIKAGLLKEMMTLVNKKAKAAITITGKRRANGLDAQGQSFYQAIKPIIKAAITNDTDAMIQIATELSDTDAIDDALAKEAAGEKLTTKEQALLDKVLAFDTFGDILNMELEEVQNLLDGLKGVRSESIVRLNEKRAERAAQREAMTEEADNQIRDGYEMLFNADGTPKDRNQLNQDKAAIWQAFKDRKVWSSLKQWLDRYDFVTSPISDYFRKKLAHLGTISNILDKTGTFFTDNLYRALNRMDESNKTGYLNEMNGLDDMANSINGVTKGYKQIRRMIESVGVVKMVIDGKNVIYNGDQLLRIYALSLNEVQRNKLKNMGFTEDKINDIKKKLGPEAIEFADKLVEYFSNEYFESINDIYSLVNDVNLGYVENYFPTQTLAAKVDGKLLEDGDFNGIFNAESSPAFKERTDTSSPVDLSASFTNVVESHFQAMERYKAYAVGVKRLNDLFKIPSVNVLLEETGLKSITKNLVNMSVNPNAGVKQTQTKLSAAMNKFSGYALAFKLAQIPKQATAIAAAYEDYQFLKGRKMPVLDTAMFIIDVAKTLTLARYNFNKFYNLSGNFRDRVNKGVEGDVYGLESGGKIFKPLSQKATRLADVKRFIKSAAASPTMVGDIISVYGYMANYNRDIANGMSPEAALEKFNNYNATLQSRRATDKSTLQFSQNELTRAFTMFGSTGLLQVNKVAMAYKNIMRSIANGKVPSGKDTRAFALNLGVANALFVGASYIFALIKGDDEDKEKVKDKMFEALIGLNLLYQIPLIGGAAEEVANAIKGEKTMGGDVTNPYTSVFRKIKKQYDEDNNVIQNFRPVAEFALGMQFDPFIGLYEGVTDEFNDDVMYDILGISPSYRPQNASSLEKMNKTELKKYDPDEYERLYGPGSKGYDEEQAKKEEKSAERKARKDAMDDYYNYSSGDGVKRGGSRIGNSRTSRTSGSRIK